MNGGALVPEFLIGLEIIGLCFHDSNLDKQAGVAKSPPGVRPTFPPYTTFRLSTFTYCQKSVPSVAFSRL